MRALWFYLLFVAALTIVSCQKDEDEKIKDPLITNYNVSPNDFLASSKYNTLIIEVQYPYHRSTICIRAGTK